MKRKFNITDKTFGIFLERCDLMAHAINIKIYRKRKVVAYDDLSHRNTGNPCVRAETHRRQYDTRAPSR